MAQQVSFLTKLSKEHGGSHSVGKRRRRRSLNCKQAHHVTLKSHHAIGGRGLLKHKKLILSVMKRASFLFEVKVYEYAICGNHIHLLVKGPSRESLQNFFRVFAGHTAQKILELCPLPLKLPQQKSPDRGGALPNPQEKQLGCEKNQRKFWGYLIYSRIVSWGREFKTVTNYIIKNTLEALHIIAYQTRTKKRTSGKNKDSS